MGLTHKHREGNNLSVSYADSSPSRRALGISVNGARPLGFLQISKWRALLSRVGSAMAKNLLVGVGSKARKVKSLYVGVGGKARKVKKVYVGVGGKARLVYQSYIPVKGITITKTFGSYSSPDKYPFYANLTANISPSNATNQTITWTTSDATVCGFPKDVDFNGHKFSTFTNSSYIGSSCKVGCLYSSVAIPGNRAGVATITAKSADGASASFKVRTFTYTDKDGDTNMGMEWY